MLQWGKKCSKEFVNAPDRTQYVRDVHGEKQYKCSICRESFARKTNLRTHTKRAVHLRKSENHTNVKPKNN